MAIKIISWISLTIIGAIIGMVVTDLFVDRTGPLEVAVLSEDITSAKGSPAVDDGQLLIENRLVVLNRGTSHLSDLSVELWSGFDFAAWVPIDSGVSGGGCEVIKQSEITEPYISKGAGANHYDGTVANCNYLRPNEYIRLSSKKYIGKYLEPISGEACIRIRSTNFSCALLFSSLKPGNKQEKQFCEHVDYPWYHPSHYIGKPDSEVSREEMFGKMLCGQ